MRHQLIPVSLLLLPLLAAAQDDRGLAPVPSPPVMPPEARMPESLPEQPGLPPDVRGLQPLPEQPDLPPAVQSGEQLEPDITILRRGDQLIQEYRINGELYMVKIIPDAGPPYYLVDVNGDGNLDVRRSDVERNLKIPQWILFSW